MRAVVDRGGLGHPAVSMCQMRRFEPGWLTSEAELAALAGLLNGWIDGVHARGPQTTPVLGSLTIRKI